MLIEDIQSCETNFPELFAKKITKEYGFIYYNDENKGSYDSNHAILFPDCITNLANVLDDITQFYLDKNITPRIYQLFINRYFETNKEIFINKGYVVNEYGINKYMLLGKSNSLIIKDHTKCQLLRQWDQDIEEHIFIPSGEEYEIPVVKKYLDKKNCFIFVGYYKNAPVSISYIHRDINKDVTRFDYILTTTKYRKMGFGVELLNYIINYCYINNIYNCYQWPANTFSEKMCYKAGFRTLFESQSAEAIYTTNLKFTQ